MPQVQQKVFLISEQQRNALLNYLLDRPYREVAQGIEFLKNAPTTIVNIEVPAEQMPQSQGEEVPIANAPSNDNSLLVTQVS